MARAQLRMYYNVNYGEPNNPELQVDYNALRFLRIEPQDYSNFDHRIAVRICKVVSLKLFYFQPYNSYALLLDTERELAKYYEENPDVRIPKCDEAPVTGNEFYGMYSKTKKRWVRVLKDMPLDDLGAYSVLMIDYAEREFVVASEKRLRHLPRQFCSLEAQGFSAELYVTDRSRLQGMNELHTCSFREKVLHQKVEILPVGSNLNPRGHPYLPKFSVYVLLSSPINNSWWLGGLRQTGTETMPQQKALIEVTRLQDNTYVTRKRGE